MKPCFTHREPSHVTLLNDPAPVGLAENRAKVEDLMKTAALVMATKSTRRKATPGQPGS